MKYPLTCLQGNNNLAFVSAPLRAYKGDTALAIGTGFFFRPDFDRTFLITNRHLVIEEQNEFYPDHLQLTLHTNPDDLTKFRTLDVALYSGDTERKRAWLELEREIDVIALELRPEELKSFVIHTFRTSDLISPDIFVGVGDPLVVIGYPEGFSDSVHNLPVFRQASVASVYPIPFEDDPFFLIDSELHPGTSGSPVITQPSIWQVKHDGGGLYESEMFEEPQYRLIGVHSATYENLKLNVDLKLNVTWFASLLVDICRKAEGIEIK